jgi:hypothetical protein
MLTEERAVKSGRGYTLIFVAAAVAVFLTLFYIFLPATSVVVQREKKCGDGVCDEDCFTCPADCPCGKGVCYNDMKKCGSLPDDVTSLMEKTYGRGNYTITGSWTEAGERIFHAAAGGRDLFIKNGSITEMEPL